jgi:hypothetical protein
MGFTLVTTGEHYVSDLLLGGAYAFVAHLGWTRIERWWEARSAPPLDEPASPQYEEPPLV